MKRKCLILATICCLFGSLFSCQDDYDKSEVKTSDYVDPNLKIAEKNLNNFIKFIEPNTKSSGNELSVISVAKKSLPLKLKDSLATLQTRSSLSEMKDSADLYIFTFTKGENKGYAIVSGEERVPKLYAYVEKGNIADTTINGGLNQALGMIDEIYQDDVLGAYVMGTRSSDISTYANYTQSLTRLEWGQGAPYNRNVPVNCSNVTGKAPAGCVQVAVGMAVAAGESIFAVQEDQVNLHNKVPRIYNVSTDPHADWVANFLIKIGSFCKIQYSCGGSSGTAGNVSMALSHYWMSHQLEQGLNANWTKNSLNAGRPIIAFGSPVSGSGAGHCWLLDGGVKDASGNYTHFYCNWGYDGWDNGYFATNDFCKYTDEFGNVTDFNRSNQYIYIFDFPK